MFPSGIELVLPCAWPFPQRDERRQEHEKEPEHRKSVGNEKVLRVGDRYAEENGCEYSHSKSRERQPELQERSQPEDAYEELHDRILDRDALATPAAALARLPCSRRIRSNARGSSS